MSKRHNTTETLPNAVDFDPYDGCLDAQSAWQHFGGLSIDEAYSKFIENPFYYQEDFMFMGGKAFVFYFPVLDRYLREFKVSDDEDDSSAAIIGAGFSTQLISPTSHELDSIISEIRDLVTYVCDNYRLLASDHDEQKEIDSHWQILQTQILANKTR